MSYASTGYRDQAGPVVKCQAGAVHAGQDDAGGPSGQRGGAGNRQRLTGRLTDTAGAAGAQIEVAAQAGLAQRDVAAGAQVGVAADGQAAAGGHAQMAAHADLQVAAHQHRAQHQVVDIIDGRVVGVDAQGALEVVGLDQRHVLAGGVDGDVTADHPDLAVVHPDRAVIADGGIDLQTAGHAGREDVHASSGGQADVTSLGQHHPPIEAVERCPAAAIGQGDVAGTRAVEGGQTGYRHSGARHLGQRAGVGQLQRARRGDGTQTQAVGIGQVHVASRDHCHRPHKVVGDVAQCQVVGATHTQLRGAIHPQGARLRQGTVRLQREVALDRGSAQRKCRRRAQNGMTCDTADGIHRDRTGQAVAGIAQRDAAAAKGAAAPHP